MTKARPEHTDGRRKLSDEARAKLSAAGRAQYERQTPEQRAAQLARIGRKPKGDPAAAGGVDTGAGADPPPVAGQGRRNPLAMTPGELVRALRGRG